MVLIRTIATLLLVLSGLSCGSGTPQSPALSPRGSMEFWFYVENDYYNGVEPQGDLVVLAEAQDAFKVTLDSPSIEAAAAQAEFGAKEGERKAGEKKPPSSEVNLEFLWLMKGGNRLNLFLPLLPGREWYHLAYRWDCNEGIFDGFINGEPLRISGTKVSPWEIAGMALDVKTAPSVEDFTISDEFWSDNVIVEKSKKRQHGDIAPLIGYSEKTPMDGVEALKGRLLYSVDTFNADAVNDWRMEGPGAYEFDIDGWMTLESTEIDAGGPGDGHFVFWAPGVYPENFIMEFDFQAITDEGLCIILFAAMGQNGKDIFDPSLKPRDGHFAGYIRGDMNCYHISYYANIPTNPGRITSNLRKNYGFYLVSNGPPGVAAGSKDIHTVTLVKNNGAIRLGVDGMTVIDWMDDGKKYGPLHGAGSIALRQMKWMKARYRNFRIWELK